MKYDLYVGVFVMTCYLICLVYIAYSDIVRRLKKQPSRLETLFSKENFEVFKSSVFGKKAFIVLILQLSLLSLLLAAFLSPAIESHTITKFLTVGAVLFSIYFAETFIVKYKIRQMSIISILLTIAATAGLAKVMYDPVDFRLGFFAALFSLFFLIPFDYNIKRYLFLNKN